MCILTDTLINYNRIVKNNPKIMTGIKSLNDPDMLVYKDKVAP
ncbi:hypothetical protein B4102_2841 [Heyndrickxia sporothermodurans]|uniref:Uncharacterized protein n=1 Tax=Heyndrickxia sporothermodurans TaxID=46224 RepID=A0A150L7I4_9BACI|nr:hypothetical protein B4102_2841 [Heyndrickxia sporothermodurans]